MNDSIEDRIKRSMDGLTDAIDVDTQVKLNEARFQALQQHSRPKLHHWLQRWLWPLVGTAALMLLLTVMPNMIQNESMQEPNAVLFEDVEFLAEEVETEFYEDLDFLAWLDDNQLLESDI